MGKLLDQYKAFLEKNKFTEEKVDLVNDPQGFLKNNRNKRKVNRMKEAYSASLGEIGLSMEQVKNAYLGVFKTEEKVNMILENSGKDYKYDLKAWEYIEKNKPELLNTLTPEEKGKLALDDTDFKAEKSKEFIQKGMLTQKEQDDILASRVLMESLKMSEKNNEAFLDSLEKELTEEQLAKADKAFREYTDIMDRPEETWTKYPFKETCDNLLKNIPEKVAKDENKLKQYKHALEFAGEHLQRPNEEFKAEMAIRETSDYQPFEVPITENVVSENEKTYKNGKYNDLFEEKEMFGSPYYVVKKDRLDDYKDFRNEKMEIGDKTKQGIKEILEQMDSMELFKHSVSANGEDGNKTYVFCKFAKDQEELEKALKEGDPDKIIEASGKVEKNWNDLEKLYDIARTHFSQDETFFPGNMDSVRSAHLPTHFTRDLMTTAQINNLFLAHLSLHNSGMTIDQYLDNPTKTVVDGFFKQAEKGSFEELSKEASESLEDSLDLLFQTGKYQTTGDRYVSGTPATMAKRTVGGPLALEEDKKIRNGNMVYTQKLVNAIEGSVVCEQSKFGALQHKPKTEKEYEERRITLENLILVNEKDRDLNAMLGGNPPTDLIGGITGKAITPEEYVKKSNISYDVAMARAETIKQKVANSQKIQNCISVNDVIEAEVSAYGKLLAKGFSLNSKENGELKAVFERNVETLLSQGDPAQAKRIQEIIANKDRSIAEYRPEYVMDDIDAAIKSAKIGVHNGSGEFDKAEKALEQVKKAYEELQNLKYNEEYSRTDSPLKKYQMEKAAIANLHEKMNNADELIDKYFARKTRQKEMGPEKKKAADLDPKSQKRINIMQRAKNSLKAYSHIMDEREMKLDEAEVIRVKGESRAADGKRIYTNREEYTKNAKEAEAKGKFSMDKFVAEGAARSYKELDDLGHGKGKKDTDIITAEEMKKIYVDLADLILDEMMKTPKGDIIRAKMPNNKDTYNKEINRIVNSPEFKKTVPETMTRIELRNLIADKQNIKKLYEKFEKELENTAKKELKAAEKEKDKNLENGGLNRTRNRVVIKQPNGKEMKFGGTGLNNNKKPDGMNGPKK